LLVVYGPKNLKRHGDCVNLSLAFHLAPECGKSGSMFGDILFFFGEKKCKMNRNRNKSKVWGVSHPER